MVIKAICPSIRLSHGKPEIINSDQGGQYTCPAREEACEEIRISMDGRSRCLDNVWIVRFWRTIKREYVYITPTDSVKELREGIKDYIEYHNTKRPHQDIEHRIPRTKYTEIDA
ncbi:MAG: integrase core domain-containing protein [Bacteroidales bacterium]|nr:integrase core domain-containing protein [Bacteroidales bacterium]